jgi:hypothetical protein
MDFEAPRALLARNADACSQRLHLPPRYPGNI